MPISTRIWQYKSSQNGKNNVFLKLFVFFYNNAVLYDLDCRKRFMKQEVKRQSILFLAFCCLTGTAQSDH